MKLLPIEKNQNARPRIVVDTSILISATLTDGPYRRLIRELITSDFEICIPVEVIEESKNSRKLEWTFTVHER